MDIKEEDILGPEIARHWYYVSKGRALQYFLRHVRKASLLDVGAGSGVFSRQLLDAGVCEQATCVILPTPKSARNCIAATKLPSSGAWRTQGTICSS